MGDLAKQHILAVFIIILLLSSLSPLLQFTEIDIVDTVKAEMPLPEGNNENLGWELLDSNTVLHIWNRYDSYYFNTSSGIQLTNHYNEYWSHNVLMLGYYAGDEWKLLYRTDELTGFNKNITGETDSYINATIWKDLSYNDYNFRLAIRYCLGVNDSDLTIIPYIKNLGIEIPYVLGFGWEMKDIQIDATEENDYIYINRSTYILNQTLNLSFTDLPYDNLNRSGFEIYENMIFNTSKYLYLKWDKNLTYKVTVKNRMGQYNAPTTLFIRVGSLATGQEKYTKMHWLDAATMTYYFNSKSTSVWTDSGYMIDNILTNYATTDVNTNAEVLDGNTCPGDDLGIITKVELRVYAHGDGGDRIDLIPVFGGVDDGDTHETTPGVDPDWGTPQDITTDTNNPSPWSWSDVQNLDCKVKYTKDGKANTMYCSKVEIRVTFAEPPFTYLYAAGGTTQKVWKILTANMLKDDECADDYGDNIWALTEDADYIYCSGATTQKVWKIQKSDMVKSLESADYGGTIYALTEDADYIYCSGATTRKVWKIQKSDMVKSLESADYGGSIWGLTEDADYIYCSGTTTRKVWKIQKSDMVKVDECADVYGGTIYALTEDADYVYASGFITQKVWKIRKSDMVKVGESDDYGGTIRALADDADYVYCAGYTTQKVWKIQKSDMVKSLESADYGGAIWALAEDDDYVYCGGDVTKKVWKIQKSDMVKSLESADYGGIIYALSTLVPPENTAPTIAGEIPANTSTGLSVTPQLNVTVDDADDDWLNVTWLSNSSNDWVWFAKNSSIDGATLPLSIVQTNSNFSAYSTTYYWSVNVSDGTTWTNETYHFTTSYAPVLSNPGPANGSIDQSRTPVCNVTASDQDGGTLTVYFYENTTGSWVLQQTNSSHTANTSAQWDSYTNASSYSTKYWWKVNVSDGKGCYDEEIYHFTTAANIPPTQSGEVPGNGSTGISITPDLYVLCTDADSDVMTATWRSNSSGAWVDFATNTSISTGTNITQTNSNFSAYSTTYWWSVNLTDGKDWVNETYHFTTKSEYNPPTQSIEVPANGSVGISLIPDLYVLCNDIDIDNMNATWWSNSSNSWVQFASNWTSFADNTNITQTNSNFSAYSTTYYWSVNLTDGMFWCNETYHFQTKANTAPTQSNQKIWNSTTATEKSLNATDVDLYPTSFNVTINDADGDKMNITILTNESDSWTVVNQTSDGGLTNGTYNFTNCSWVDSYNTKYWISFNVTDGTGWTNGTYHFTTAANTAPTQSGEVPANASTGIGVTPNLYVLCNDANNDNMNATWWSNSSGVWLQFASNWTSFADNTNITQTNSNFSAYSTTYYWSVNLTDGMFWCNETYHFTTEAINTSVDAIIPYIVISFPLNITATGSSALSNVTLWYRYSSDNSWAYSKECNIANNLDDYQIQIIVGNSSGGDVTCNGHAQSDFGDIRFVSSTGNEIPYWMESYTVDTQATFWINNSYNDSKILMYYGISTFSNTSNGSNTFIFFDDFEGADYNHDVWYTLGSEHTWTVSDSIMTMQSTGDPGSEGAHFMLKPEANITVPYGHMWYTKLSSKRDPNIWATMPRIGSYSSEPSPDDDNMYMWYRSADGDHMRTGYSFNGVSGGADDDISSESWTDDAWHYFIMSRDPNAPYASFQVLKEDKSQWGNKVEATLEYYDDFSPFEFSYFQRPYTSGGNTKVDWVFVRNWTAGTPPTWSSFGSEYSNWLTWNNINNPDTSSPWSWNFNFPNGTGYYEFYSIGKKSESPDENAPETRDASCYYPNTAPTQSNQTIWNATTATEKSLNATDVDLYPTSFNVTINDADGDKMNITILTNESDSWTVVNQTTGSGLSNGTYNFTNTSWISDYNTTYYISFNLTDGTDWANETYHFTTEDLLWIDITNISWALGTVATDARIYTNETGKTFICDMDRTTVNTDLSLQITTDGATWHDGATPASDVYRLNASIDTWSNEFLITEAIDQTISSDITAYQNETFDLRFDAPTSTSVGVQQTITITATIVKH